MAIKRNTNQGKSENLEEFYVHFGEAHPRNTSVSNAMLFLIDMIDHLFKETTIWGLTSHSRLILQNEDNSQSPPFVYIYGGDSTYEIGYLLPKEISPWPRATVRGEASSPEEAIKYLLIAMKESGGWKDNKELKGLLSENNL